MINISHVSNIMSTITADGLSEISSKNNLSNQIYEEITTLAKFRAKRGYKSISYIPIYNEIDDFWKAVKQLKNAGFTVGEVSCEKCLTVIISW